MSIEKAYNEMKKRGYRFIGLVLDVKAAKRHIGPWAENAAMNGTVLTPAWLLSEGTDGSFTVILGSEPGPTSEPITISEDEVKKIYYIEKAEPFEEEQT